MSNENSCFISVHIVGVSSYPDDSPEGMAVSEAMKQIGNIVQRLDNAIPNGGVSVNIQVVEGTVKLKHDKHDKHENVSEADKKKAVDGLATFLAEKAMNEGGRCDCRGCTTGWEIVDGYHGGGWSLNRAYSALRDLTDREAGSSFSEQAQRFAITPDSDADDAAWLMMALIREQVAKAGLH